MMGTEQPQAALSVFVYLEIQVWVPKQFATARGDGRVARVAGI